MTASTLTTVCVFLPIVFVEGITKQLFTDLALTMTYSLLASLIVALTLVPAMAAGMLQRISPSKPGLLDKVYPGYRKAVSWSGWWGGGGGGGWGGVCGGGLQQGFVFRGRGGGFAEDRPEHRQPDHHHARWMQL